MFVCGPQYLALPRNTTTWVIEDLLPSGGALNIYGRPKAGKSLAALQMAHCISNANIQDFLGFPIHRHGPVAYLQLDTPRSIWTLDMEHGVEDLQMDFTNVHVTDKELAPKPFNVMNPLTVAQVAKAVQTLAPVCVFIDTIRKTHDMDEDKSTQMKMVYEHLSQAVPDTAMVIISHNRKGQAGVEDDLMSGNRGSNYIAGEVDVVLAVSKKPKQPGAGMFVYEGRTIPERRLDLLRTEHGFWRVDEESWRKRAFELLGRKGQISDREHAKDLSEATGMHPEAARSLIRRLQQR